MQIKTIGCITIGLGLGWMMFAKDESKEKAFLVAKKVLYRWQTGKELQTNKPKYNGYNATYKPTTYREYFNKKENNPEFSSTYKKSLIFKSKQECYDLLDWLQTTGDHGSDFVSVYELLTHQGMNVPWEWDNYGWSRIDILKATIKESESVDPLEQGKIYKLDIASPHLQEN